MTDLKQMASEFLAQKTIAIAGVSRSATGTANAIYRKLRETGHTVFAVNPNPGTIDGEPFYPDLQSIPQPVDGVFMLTTPEVTEQVVQQAIAARIPRVWMHQSFGNSVSAKAVQMCHENGITVIAGACPMMFAEPVDFGHKCIKWWMGVTGKLPQVKHIH